MTRKKSVLFVCTGNICRSVTAEGVLRRLTKQAGLQSLIDIDSAGTQGYHSGNAPDPRTQSAARERGYDLSKLRARKLEASDFERFDLLLAMDEDHRRVLARMAPKGAENKIKMMMSYARHHSCHGVPDPYYGGPEGFRHVLDLLEDAAEGLLDDLRQEIEQV